jgi:hypothetical protein
MSKLKQIDFTKDVIPANGKEYKVLKELTIERFKQLDKMEVEFFYGFDMKGLFDKLTAAFGDLNKNKPADASVKIHNLIKGIADRIDDREHVVLRICSLFLITDDEDITKWDEDLAKKKAKDWAEEGYTMSSFFSLVANFLPGFLAAYENATQDTSEQTPNPEQTKSKA